MAYRVLFVAGLMLAAAAVSAAPVTVRIRAGAGSVPMGRTVAVTAVATQGGAPAAGVELWPYVNGRRWGAHVVTDARGAATLPLPLPNAGTARIQVAVAPPKWQPDSSWIWGPELRDNQTLWFVKRFTPEGKVRRAELQIAADDVLHAFLNGRPVAQATDFHKVQHTGNLQLRTGENVLAAECLNGTGPAGLAALLTLETAQGSRRIATDATWEVFVKRPAGWPEPAERGVPAKVVAPVGEGVWGGTIVGWKGLEQRQCFPVGQPIPVGLPVSNTIRVQVERQRRMGIKDPDHLVGMEWEPWFTPLNINWSTAQAEPIVGFYDSYNADVIRQHALWLVDAGIDFILVDWTNNLWDKKHWSERGEYVNELIRGTQAMLDVYAGMRKEGIPVPQVALILGLDNGPQTTMEAINEEIAWVADHWVHNPRYAGLWLQHEGKPLITVFNGGGPGIRKGKPPVDESQFTVRWMASQLQGNHLEHEGYWSWMDGIPHPVPTMRAGACEALTITPAFFADGGWLAPFAYGRRGGATYLEGFAAALEHRPKFLILNQWNEFAGQPEGAGYGPKKDIFVDCYSADLSNDIEPTSLFVPGYRSPRGWGYTYLNLTRALVDLYHQKQPATTLLALSKPEAEQKVFGEKLDVAWVAVGKAPAGYTVKLDGKEVARGLKETKWSLPLAGVAASRHTLSVLAEGCVSRFAISATTEDDPLPTPAPAEARVEFVVGP